MPGRISVPIPWKDGTSPLSVSRVVPGRGCSSWSRATEPSGLRMAIMLRSNRPSAIAFAGALLAGDCELVTLGPGEPLERGNGVGRDSLGHHRVALAEVGVVPVDQQRRLVGRPTRHRLDPAGDDELLKAGADAHGSKADGLLARPAEAVDGETGRLHRPAAVEHRQAGDVGVVVADRIAVAHNDIVDLGRIEAVALDERNEALSQEILRVQVVQRTTGAALAPRGANPVDDQCVSGVGHGASVRGSVIVSPGFPARPTTAGCRRRGR